MFDDELHGRKRSDFETALKTMKGTDAKTLAKNAAEAVVDISLDFDKTSKEADVYEALMATKARADSN